MAEIKLLKSQNKEKYKMIAQLESRLDDLEQYSRMNDIIVNSLETKHRSYASVSSVRTNRQDSDQELQTLEEQVVAFFGSKGMPIESNDIEADIHSLAKTKRPSI